MRMASQREHGKNSGFSPVSFVPSGSLSGRGEKTTPTHAPGGLDHCPEREEEPRRATLDRGRASCLNRKERFSLPPRFKLLILARPSAEATPGHYIMRFFGMSADGLRSDGSYDFAAFGTSTEHRQTERNETTKERRKRFSLLSPNVHRRSKGADANETQPAALHRKHTRKT